MTHPFAAKHYRRHRAAALFALFLAGNACAAHQDLSKLRDQARDWLRQGSERTYPGSQAAIEMGQIDPRLRLAACPAPAYALPSGGHYWGAGSVEVRCATPQLWRFYLNYRIRLSGPALMTRQPLAARAAIRPGDVETRQIEYSQPPEAYLRTLPGEVLSARPLAAGRALTLDALILPALIQAGREVSIVAQGRGFSLAQRGIALASAGAGQQVKVRIAPGRIVQGIVRSEGVVEVNP